MWGAGALEPTLQLPGPIGTHPQSFPENNPLRPMVGAARCPLAPAACPLQVRYGRRTFAPVPRTPLTPQDASASLPLRDQRCPLRATVRRLSPRGKLAWPMAARPGSGAQRGAHGTPAGACGSASPEGGSADRLASWVRRVQSLLPSAPHSGRWGRGESHGDRPVGPVRCSQARVDACCTSCCDGPCHPAFSQLEPEGPSAFISEREANVEPAAATRVPATMRLPLSSPPRASAPGGLARHAGTPAPAAEGRPGSRHPWAPEPRAGSHRLLGSGAGV